LATQRLRLTPRYTRSDPRGQFPRVTGYPGIEHNRLAIFWRPIIDMTDSPYAPMRLRMIRHVSTWLTDTTTPHRCWFAMIGVPGLRRQVIRHAGLHDYDCTGPAGLPARHQTPAWHTLVDAISNYPDLDDNTRCLVIFQLAQLSFTPHVFTLAGPVHPTGDPAHDRYAYEVARIHGRYPTRTQTALRIFGTLAETAADPLLRLEACYQNLGQVLRHGGDPDRARDFEQRGKRVGPVAESPYSVLIRSRFHRACAMLRRQEGNLPEMRSELDAALRLGQELAGLPSDDGQQLAAAENTRSLIELQIQIACDGGANDEVRELCSALGALDPGCVEARLTIGDALARIGDLGAAARWYSAAGELGTTAGALGWFRAGQCHCLLGDQPEAIHAMGRCLELDTSAVEPARYLARIQHQ
jgi:tetratricopeptide (TPR) repeat protein